MKTLTLALSAAAIAFAGAASAAEVQVVTPPTADAPVIVKTFTFTPTPTTVLSTDDQGMVSQDVVGVFDPTTIDFGFEPDKLIYIWEDGRQETVILKPLN